MQDIPEVIAPDGRPFWKPIKVLIHLLMRLGRIIPHDGEYHAIGAGKMRSRAGSAGEALVEIQGTERPTALANSARSATVRFPEA